VANTSVKSTFSSYGEIPNAIEPSLLELKISVSEYAVRYFVLNNMHKQIIFYGEHILHYVSTSDELAHRFEKTADKDELLQLGYGNVVWGCNNAYEVLPAGFAVPANDLLVMQRVGDAKILFNQDDKVKSAMLKKFPSASISHLLSVWFQQTQNLQSKLLVNVDRTFFDLVFYDETGDLKLATRYSYQTAKDFIYYVLLCCEDLNIDRTKTELILAGEITQQSEIYSLCYRYFSHVNFFQPDSSIYFSKSFEEFPAHLHYNLYNLKA
jgi:hypothetical protein